MAAMLQCCGAAVHVPQLRMDGSGCLWSSWQACQVMRQPLCSKSLTGMRAEDHKQEASEVVAEIQRLHASGRHYKDVCVLLRAFKCASAKPPCLHAALSHAMKLPSTSWLLQQLIVQLYRHWACACSLCMPCAPQLLMYCSLHRV